MRGLIRTVAAAAAVAFLILAGAAATIWGFYRDLNRPGPLAAAETVVIPHHKGVAEIARLLAERGVIRHAWTFRLGVALSDLGGELVAGEYQFPPGTSPRDAITMLAEGEVLKHRLSVPEGLTSAEVMALLAAAPALAGDAGEPPPDGALMPDTYIYSYGDKRRDLLAQMRRAMTEAVATAWGARHPDLPLQTPQQLVTLASLVERETGRADERAHVAAVFVNRLRLGMPLQSDPTVIYALSEHGAKKFDRPLTRADLAVASPYNTYVAKGLPPGPIDNPGLASLDAAARPAASEDLYFVADGNGGHVFAKTLPEHLQNVQRYRKELAALAAAAAPPPPPPEAKPAGPPPQPTAATPERRHPAIRIVRKKGAPPL